MNEKRTNLYLIEFFESMKNYEIQVSMEKANIFMLKYNSYIICLLLFVLIIILYKLEKKEYRKRQLDIKNKFSSIKSEQHMLTDSMVKSVQYFIISYYSSLLPSKNNNTFSFIKMDDFEFTSAQEDYSNISCKLEDLSYLTI